MKIETTLGELVEAEAALDRVLAVKLDAKTRYHAVKLARLVKQETKHFHDERNALVEKLGTDGLAGAKEIRANSPAMAQFVAELKPMYEIPVTVEWGPLTRAMLEPYLDVTGKDQIDLGPLFELEPATPSA